MKKRRAITLVMVMAFAISLLAVTINASQLYKYSNNLYADAYGSTYQTPLQEKTSEGSAKVLAVPRDSVTFNYGNNIYLRMKSSSGNYASSSILVSNSLGKTISYYSGSGRERSEYRVYSFFDSYPLPGATAASVTLHWTP